MSEKTNPLLDIHELMSKKWVMLILKNMCHCGHSVRFNEMKSAIPDINSNALSTRLTELEEHGLITRTVENTRPVTIRYSLTPKACELKKIFSELAKWSDKWDQ